MPSFDAEENQILDLQAGTTDNIDPRPELSNYGIHPQLYYDDYDEYLRLYKEYKKDFYAWAKRTNYEGKSGCGC